MAIAAESTKSASYLLRMTPAEKADLEALADEHDVTLAEALRQGARIYLTKKEPFPVVVERREP